MRYIIISHINRQRDPVCDGSYLVKDFKRSTIPGCKLSTTPQFQGYLLQSHSQINMVSDFKLCVRYFELFYLSYATLKCCLTLVTSCSISWSIYGPSITLFIGPSEFTIVLHFLRYSASIWLIFKVDFFPLLYTNSTGCK